MQRHLNGEAVMARPPSALYRFQKVVHKHRGVFSAVACIFLTLVAGIAASTWHMMEAREAKRVAVAAEWNQSQLLEKAETGRARALSSERDARLSTYVADINLTYHALQDGNYRRALQLIRKHVPTGDTDDFRGFEWRHLAGVCRGDETNVGFPFQGGNVRAIVFSPDGAVVAVAASRHVQLWDVRSRSLIATLPSRARSVAFVKGALVAGGSRSVLVWNGTTFSRITELRQSGPVAISSDGSKIATGSRRGITMWDTSNWRQLAELDRATHPVAFSPDGSKVVTGSREGIAIWDATNGELVRILENSGGVLSFSTSRGSALAMSPDGRFVVAPRNRMSEKGVFVLGIWDAETGAEEPTMPEISQQVQHTGVISGLAFSPDGKTLATGSWDHSIRLWDFETRKHLRTIRGQSHEVWAIAFSPDGQTIASGGKDGSLNLWPSKRSDRVEAIPGKWRPLAITPDGRQIAVVNQEATVGFFHLQSGEMTRSIELDAARGNDDRHSRSRWRGRGFGGEAVAISANLNTLAQGLPDGSVKIWNTTTRETTILPASTERITSVALSPGARFLVTGCHRQPLQLRDLHKSESSEPVVQIEADRVIFSGDGGTMVAIGGRGETIDVWDPGALSKTRGMTITPRPGFAIALSWDGTLLATTGGMDDLNDAVRIWDTATGEFLGECSGHKQSVWSVAFSPDGKTLATSSEDSTLKFWNVDTRQEMLSIRRVGTTLSNLTFSPDGAVLAAETNRMATKGEIRLLKAPGLAEITNWLSPRENPEPTPIIQPPSARSH